MNIEIIRQKYIELGYTRPNAIAKVCQDVILNLISKSTYFKNVTIKGGVVMHSISNDKRRATRDIDLDFIKYSLDDSSIINFIKKLNNNKDGITIKINGNIEKLHHQDYDGKRVNIIVSDSYNNIMNTKLDIGVHKNFDITQEEYCFDLDAINSTANLFVNSCEQIFIEKLKSLLKFGITSTRFKDIFYFYYLINNEDLNKDKLIKYIDILIFQDENMREKELTEIHTRLTNILNNSRFQLRLSTADNNWLEIPIKDVTSNILEYFGGLVKVTN